MQVCTYVQIQFQTNNYKNSKFDLTWNFSDNAKSSDRLWKMTPRVIDKASSAVNSEQHDRFH